jgi:hypothetical protein
MCRGTAGFKSTVFRGTVPTTVKLCNDCASKIRAEEHMQKIKAAIGHDAKMAAVDEFLTAVGQ